VGGRRKGSFREFIVTRSSRAKKKGPPHLDREQEIELTLSPFKKIEKRAPEMNSQGDKHDNRQGKRDNAERKREGM